MIRVSVVGAAGYTGGEACALLARHPGVRIEGRFGSRRAQTAGSELPPLDVETLLDPRPDAVLLATPHDVSAELAPRLLAAGARVIDLSGAFRLGDPADYPRWYGFTHPAPELLEEAVYGLTEWCDRRLDGCRLVANPGCYATSALLALRPLLAALDPDHGIVCDAKSGVSGAGRRPDAAYSFAEVSGNFRAYGAAGHRHEPEIRQAADLAPGRSFVFVPHLLPVVRGILSTLHVVFRAPMTERDVAGLFHEAYERAPLVRLLPPGELPELAAVAGTPRCDIGFVLREQGRRGVIVSVLDNLLKGAASQAVQNLNRMFGRDETEGLL